MSVAIIEGIFCNKIFNRSPDLMLWSYQLVCLLVTMVVDDGQLSLFDHIAPGISPYLLPDVASSEDYNSVNTI